MNNSVLISFSFASRIGVFYLASASRLTILALFSELFNTQQLNKTRKTSCVVSKRLWHSLCVLVTREYDVVLTTADVFS